jgi:hypothetical protein
MKCDLINRESLISKYLLNELSEDENLKFEEHYFKCEECFDELKAAEEALNLMRDEGSTLFHKTRKVKKESAKSFLDKIFSGFVSPARAGIAFAAIVLIFVLFYVFYNPNSSSNTESILADDDKDSVKQFVEQEPLQPKDEIDPKQKESELLASLTGPAFDANPYYEEWINESVRSGNILVDKVILPKNSKKYLNQSVLFKWLMTENILVNLVIMNNDDDIIFTSKVSADNFPEYSFSVNQSDIGNSGLYYWRIEDDNEVLYLGKFYFIKKQESQ